MDEIKISIPYSGGLREGKDTIIKIVVLDGVLSIRTSDGILSISPKSENWVKVSVIDSLEMAKPI